ncbi:hypothetical protein Tco_0431758 [Tanacetum coccineum]
MFILYCRRVVDEDLMLAGVLNSLCREVAAIIEERELFVQELDTLVRRFVLEKTVEFMMETSGKDTEKMVELQTMEREFQLRARENNIFIEKLKGNVCF